MRRNTVVLLATVAAVACGARVPETFGPELARVSPASLTIADHGGADELAVLVFGDFGTGDDNQIEVGRRMAEACADAGCDLAITLGDNIYNNGSRRHDGDRWDPAFSEKFERPYGGLGRLDVWLVAGNHDWHRGIDSIETQIAYSEISERWRMLSYDYDIPNLPPWLHVYGLDTVILDEGVSIGQLDRAEMALCGQDGWRILFGHHPIYTTGHHDDVNGEIPRIRDAVLPLIEACGVQLYLAGHDHHQEHLATESVDYIIQGAAAKSRDVGARPASQVATQLFADRQYGFAILRLRPELIEVTFFGYPPGRPEAFGVIYQATIPPTGPTGR